MKKTKLLSTAAVICGLASIQSAFAEAVEPTLTIGNLASFSVAPAVGPFTTLTASNLSNYTGSAAITFTVTSNNYGTEAGAANVTLAPSVPGEPELVGETNTNQAIPYTLSASTVYINNSSEKTVNATITGQNLSSLDKQAYSDTVTVTLSAS